MPVISLPDRFDEVKPGDMVLRLLGEAVQLKLHVKAVTDAHIYCTPPGVSWDLDQCWKFMRTTGAEVDEELGWDGVNLTGSRLIGFERGS